MFPSEDDRAYFARCSIEQGCRIHVIIMLTAFEDLKPLGTKTAGKFRKVQMCNWSFVLWVDPTVDSGSKKSSSPKHFIYTYTRRELGKLTGLSLGK